MKRSRFTENQIVNILKEADAGAKVKDVCRRNGISDATYYNWKSKYGGMSASDLKRLKETEAELSQYKKMYAELARENYPLKDLWEGDLLYGSNNSQIATLVERHSRYCMLVRTDSKDTKTVVNALIKQAHKLPRELYKSLTWDRGKEMADHKRFSLATDIKVCFCDPQSPWQRASNEQINGLLRQYFPKGMDLSNVHQNRLNAVARQLNERPRETLHFETPAERFDQCVASIR